MGYVNSQEGSRYTSNFPNNESHNLSQSSSSRPRCESCHSLRRCGHMPPPIHSTWLMIAKAAIHWFRVTFQCRTNNKRFKTHLLVFPNALAMDFFWHPIYQTSLQTTTIPWSSLKLTLRRFKHNLARKLTCNLKVTPLKKKSIFQFSQTKKHKAWWIQNAPHVQDACDSTWLASLPEPHKNTKKKKRQKHPTTPPLCVVRKITKTTSFMLKPQNLMGFLALHLLQFSRKLPKIFTHTCCGNEAQSHAQSGPGSPGQHFSIVTASQQLCWYTLCTNKAPVVAPNLDHSKWGSPNFQSLQKERQMILVFRVDGKTYCIWSNISLLSFSKDTSWKWKILVGMTACKDVNRFNFADQKGHF